MLHVTCKFHAFVAPKVSWIVHVQLKTTFYKWAQQTHVKCMLFTFCNLRQILKFRQKNSFRTSHNDTSLNCKTINLNMRNYSSNKKTMCVHLTSYYPMLYPSVIGSLFFVSYNCIIMYTLPTLMLSLSWNAACKLNGLFSWISYTILPGYGRQYLISLLKGVQNWNQLCYLSWKCITILEERESKKK